MNINSIRYFVETARVENVTKAAKVCFISQQALSKEIANLESELGVSLFERSANHIRLSRVGRDLLPIAKAMLESYDNYSQLLFSTAAKNKDSLQVLFENEIMMSYVPYDFLGRVGNTYVTSSIAKSSEQCIRDIRDQTMDLAMLNRPPLDKIEGLEFIELSNNPGCIIVSRDHHLAQRQFVSISDLRREPVIIFDINTFWSTDFYNACAQAGFYPNVKAIWPHFSTVMSAVAAGEGYLIGGGFVAVPYEERITRIPIVHDTLRHIVGFLLNPQNPKRKEIESYIRALKALK